MESKFLNKNIFESGFDSFEFDDGFLMRLDSDLKKNKIREKQHDVKKFSSKTVVDCQQKKDKKAGEIKSQGYYDLPLLIEDLDESDFFDFGTNKGKKQSSKVLSGHKNEKPRKASFTQNPTACLSPILGPKSRTQMNLSSSTPLKPNNSNPGEKLTSEKSLEKNFDYVYSEADLFDDWDIDEPKKEGTPKSTVTLSQALKLIEEAESAKDSDQKESLNQSINLLTGEVVDVGVMFDESFDVPESAIEKEKDADSSCDSVEIIKECKAKPPAAQKLNFDKASDKEINFVDIFSSDDDFDFLTQDLLEKPKSVKPNPDLSRGDRASPLQNSDLNESTDAVVRFKKKRNCFKIIESDTTEDSPSPKFRRQNLTKKRKNCQGNFGKEFIESEAEVSDEVEVSSDEAEEEGEYDRSFLDEDSYCTQNQSANMTARYLESVKGLSGPGNFKIPAPKPYNRDNIFSQIPEENDADYEIDSFCVNEVEEEMKTELSDLEVAEKVLEMDRKKRKRKRLQQKFRKSK